VFKREPDFGVISVNYALNELPAKAEEAGKIAIFNSVVYCNTGGAL